MCGVAGLLTLDPVDRRDTLIERVTGMVRTLRHRGPDHEGYWVDEAAGLGLGHRRLAIIDLSPAGEQPMVSANGRYVLVYNGEIYNAAELREELGHIAFRGHSDTEVLLEACASWGVLACVQRLIGEFAFGLWDRETRTLTLARDRLGVKPLYWGRQDRLILFGSELKALRAHPGWRPEIDRDALAGYLRRRYVATPATIYRNVHKLLPGHLLELGADGSSRLLPFWDPVAVAAEPRSALSDAEAVDELEALLRDAVGRQMVADVPLGVFLSGGIDSSLVAALMQVQSSRPVRSFSIGFSEAAFDEAPHAKAVAQHLGTEHTELYVQPNQVLDVVPHLPALFDEPFADSSQVPTHLLAVMTKRQVTVALSGDGGDELFAGYRRYERAERLWWWVSRVPGAWRRLMAARLDAVPRTLWNRVHGLAPAGRFRPWPAGQMEVVTASLGAGSPDIFYRQRFAHWQRPDHVVRDANEPPNDPDIGITAQVGDFLTRMQVCDLMSYLPDDILTKVDRATMAVGLEARVPILDHRVVEFALRLPRHQKVRGGTSKWLMRQVLDRHVPIELIDRPKQGFAVPLAAWLRGPLRGWAEDLLDQRRLEREGYFNPSLIRERWNQHLAGKWDWHGHLWDILVFQAWLEENATAST